MKSKFLVLTLATGMSLMGLNSNVFSAPIAFTHSTSTGTSFNTTGLSSFATGGDNMHGIQVTANFAGGGSETISYDAGFIGDDFGSALGTGWSLSFSGATTFGSNWNLSTTTASIASLAINGAPGNTLFDYLFEFDVTPTSARGGPGNPSGPTNVDSTIGQTAEFVYSNRVSLNDTFYGDLFETLTISLNGPLTAGNTLSFRTDTDNVSAVGDIKRVSEPSTIAVLLFGLVGFILARRKVV